MAVELLETLDLRGVHRLPYDAVHVMAAEHGYVFCLKFQRFTAVQQQYGISSVLCPMQNPVDHAACLGSIAQQDSQHEFLCP